MSVLRRQRKGRPQLFATDRLLWVWLYRIWPQVLNAIMLVKPATVIQWNRKGFRLYWRKVILIRNTSLSHLREALLLALVERLVEAHQPRADGADRHAHGGKPRPHDVEPPQRR